VHFGEWGGGHPRARENVK
jgi:hypothetical protein